MDDFRNSLVLALEHQLRGVKEELLKLHTILMCPAECPPIQKSDTQTVRLLKGVIAQWHNAETKLATPHQWVVPDASCVWCCVEDDYTTYQTSCNQMFTLNDGTPKENEMLFCYHCGKPLDVDGAQK